MVWFEELARLVKEVLASDGEHMRRDVHTCVEARLWDALVGHIGARHGATAFIAEEVDQGLQLACQLSVLAGRQQDLQVLGVDGRRERQLGEDHVFSVAGKGGKCRLDDVVDLAGELAAVLHTRLVNLLRDLFLVLRRQACPLQLVDQGQPFFRRAGAGGAQDGANDGFGGNLLVLAVECVLELVVDALHAQLLVRLYDARHQLGCLPALDDDHVQVVLVV